MSERNSQKCVAVEEKPKATRKRKKVNIERKTKVINHYADISPEERFAIGVRIFEMLGVFRDNGENVCADKKES
jgi:hypothetical protein